MEIGLETAAPPRRAAELARTFEALGLRDAALSRQPEPGARGVAAVGARGAGDDPHPARARRHQPGDARSGRHGVRRRRRCRSRAAGGRCSASGAATRRCSGSASRRSRSPSSSATSTTLQTYLAGGAVDRDGFASRIEWLSARDVPKVPLEIAATGPKVIALAARHAERDRVRGRRRSRRISAGRSRRRARRRARGRPRPGDDPLRRVRQLRRPSRPPDGARRDARHRRDLRALLVDRRRADRPPAAAAPRRRGGDARALRHARPHARGRRPRAGARGRVPRLVRHRRPGRASSATVSQRLAALGLDFCHVVPGSFDTPRDVLRESLRLLGTEVLPGLPR